MSRRELSTAIGSTVAHWIADKAAPGLEKNLSSIAEKAVKHGFRDQDVALVSDLARDYAIKTTDKAGEALGDLIYDAGSYVKKKAVQHRRRLVPPSVAGRPTPPRLAYSTTPGFGPYGGEEEEDVGYQPGGSFPRQWPREEAIVDITAARAVRRRGPQRSEHIGIADPQENLDDNWHIVEPTQSTSPTFGFGKHVLVRKKLPPPPVPAKLSGVEKRRLIDAGERAAIADALSDVLGAKVKIGDVDRRVSNAKIPRLPRGGSKAKAEIVSAAAATGAREPAKGKARVAEPAVEKVPVRKRGAAGAAARWAGHEKAPPRPKGTMTKAESLAKAREARAAKAALKPSKKKVVIRTIDDLAA